MPTTSPSKVNLYTLMACCLLLSFDALLLFQPTTSAQSGCPDIPKLGQPHWEPNHPVAVVFQEDSNWTDDEINVMRRAFDNWNAANSYIGNNSGVIFEGF
jgi:hypothetical protein